MLHVSASAGFLPTYNLLFTVHQYVFCKHKRTWIRLIAKLPKTHLKWNYRQFCATTPMAIWQI